jgi:hypothetical protein
VTTLSLSPAASWLLWGGALITVTVWIVRRSKARSYREFVEKPNAILATLRQDASHQHEQDAL